MNLRESEKNSKQKKIVSPSPIVAAQVALTVILAEHKQQYQQHNQQFQHYQLRLSSRSSSGSSVTSVDIDRTYTLISLRNEFIITREEDEEEKEKDEEERKEEGNEKKRKEKKIKEKENEDEEGKRLMLTGIVRCK